MSLQVKLSLHLKRLFGKSECSTGSVSMMVHACGHRDKIFKESVVKDKEKKKTESHYVKISLIPIGYGNMKF
jgi:hypothetical protein